MILIIFYMINNKKILKNSTLVRLMLLHSNYKNIPNKPV